MGSHEGWPSVAAPRPPAVIAILSPPPAHVAALSPALREPVSGAGEGGPVPVAVNGQPWEAEAAALGCLLTAAAPSTSAGAHLQLTSVLGCLLRLAIAAATGLPPPALLVGSLRARDKAGGEPQH